MTVDNGVMKRKTTEDTVKVTAWFTSDIPVAVGPAEYQGQLPGAILEVATSDGRQTYVATAINPKPDMKELKEPTGKKHLSAAEFKAEQAKMMDQMGKNMRQRVKSRDN